MFDHLGTYVSPGSWVTDLQCLRLGYTPQESIKNQLFLTLGIIPITCVVFGLLIFLGSICGKICCRGGA